MARKSLSIRPARGILSISFDDVPRSACCVGAAILHANGALATFYIAMGLTGQRTEVGECFLKRDLEALLGAGHELGCHTFSHVPVNQLDISGLERELDQNARALAEVARGRRFSTFAYPFGEVTLRAKRQLAARFAAARGIQGGAQTRRVDLAHVRAVKLYSSETPLELLLEQVEHAARARQWLVLFGHDVDERPSPYGCTPAYLEGVLEAAQHAGLAILPIRSAIGTIAFSDDPSSRSMLRGA